METDCDRCEMRGTGCQDCVITRLQPRNVAGFSGTGPGHLSGTGPGHLTEAPGFFTEAPGHLTEAPGHLTEAPGFLAGAPFQLTEAEVKALGVLAAAGLVPPLRLSLPGTSRPGAAVRSEPRPWAERTFPETKASLCFRD